MHGFQDLCISPLDMQCARSKRQQRCCSSPLCRRLVKGIRKRRDDSMKRLECHTCTYFDQSPLAGNTRSYRKTRHSCRSPRCMKRGKMQSTCRESPEPTDRQFSEERGCGASPRKHPQCGCHLHSGCRDRSFSSRRLLCSDDSVLARHCSAKTC